MGRSARSRGTAGAKYKSKRAAGASREGKRVKRPGPRRYGPCRCKRVYFYWVISSVSLAVSA